MKKSTISWCWMFIALATASTVMAQPGDRPLDITADSLEYLSDKKMMIGKGNVLIRDGDMQLSADYMSVQTETKDVHAKGNVFYKSGTQTWRGEEFHYNMRSKQGDFGSFKAFYDPLYITASDSKRLGEDHIQLKDVTLTTCDGERPGFSVHGKEASLSNNRVRVRSAVVYLADTVPIFYMPYFTRDLGSNERFMQWVPGYNSRLGAFLLTGFNYPLFGEVRGITRLDYRSKRGFGFGQDFTWKDRVDKTYEGFIQGYYTKDDEPLEGSASESREGVVEEERYRVRAMHNQTLSERDTFLGELNYLSDPYILKDFFRKEFREAVQPENRATLTHRGDRYLAGLQVNKRLNDFYENVDRVPELTLDVPRLNLGESDFFYQSQNSVSYLDRVFPEGSKAEDYDAFRFDTGHQLNYPFRLGGFLNLIPRAGYRGTMYSKTYTELVRTNSTVETGSDGVSFVSNRVTTTIRENGSGFRSLPELGWEGSFKAFKSWNDLLVLGDGDGLRHIAEPYLDHTYIPEPNLLPQELPQFDSIDRLGERHDIKLGFRNKLQTRWDDNPADIIDLDVFSFYRVEKEEGQEDFTDIFFDADLQFSRNFLMEADAAYDAYESTVNTFSARFSWLFPDESLLGAEYRYRLDNQSLISGYLNLFPKDRWSLDLGARYNAEESELEEQFYMLKHKGSCFSWGLGVRQLYEDEEDDEVEVWLMVWLTAVPNALIQMDY